MTEHTHPGRYAVVGASGQQGAAAVRALLGRGADVRAMVRDVDSTKAQRLRDLGATPIRADLDEPASVTAAFQDVEGAFAMTTFMGERGTDGEVEHGRTIAAAAAEAGLPLLVYSSVGGAERHTGIPHFDSKRRVEEYMGERLNVRFIRPTYFMENLSTAAAPSDSSEIVVRQPLAEDVPLQMIAVKDIGIIAATMLLDPDAIDVESVEIAGDELTGMQIAARIGAHLGKPARYEALPLDALDSNEDQKAMFRWFADVPAYRADRETTRRLDPDVLSFADWLSSQR